MDSLETLAQTNLLKSLQNSKIQKIKEIPKGFSFELYCEGKRKFLILVPELGFFLSDSGYNAVDMSNLGKMLRDKLTNQRILSINQHDRDRIIEVETQDFIIFLEFFRNGNVILTEKTKRTIIIAKEMRAWRHRTVKPHHEYKYPPPSKFTLPEDFSDELKKLGDVNSRLRTEYEKMYNQYKLKDVAKRDEKLQRIKRAQLLKLKELTQERSLLEGYVDAIYLKYADFEKNFEEIKNEQKHGIGEALGVPLNVRKTLNQNLQDFFKRIKQIKKKIVGLSASIETVELVEAQKKVEQEEYRPSQKKWYAKFRWFISSNDFLVVGGKDAKSNEQLVRKYLKPQDLVFHTDITGSPFVIVKNPDKKSIPGKTIEEASQFCASYSKAWKIGISTADVYYVKPEQVKKEGGLPTGSFMIYGKRNWIRRVGLKLAIGIKGNEVVYGPETAVQKQTENYILITAGNENYVEILKKRFGNMFDMIKREIPYGMCRIVSFAGY